MVVLWQELRGLPEEKLREPGVSARDTRPPRRPYIPGTGPRRNNWRRSQETGQDGIHDKVKGTSNGNATRTLQTPGQSIGAPHDSNVACLYLFELSRTDVNFCVMVGSIAVRMGIADPRRKDEANKSIKNEAT